MIVDFQIREFYGILKEADPHLFAFFSIKFHPVTRALRGNGIETGLNSWGAVPYEPFGQQYIINIKPIVTQSLSDQFSSISCKFYSSTIVTTL